jgi:hypothetical protein
MSSGLVSVWSEWERRLAVVAGTLVAFVALLEHCPVWVACARGAAALAVVLLLGHGIARALAWSVAGDRQEAAARARSSADAARPPERGERRG